MTGRKMFVLTGMFLLLGLAACSMKDNNMTKIRDLDYTVLEDEEVPGEFLAQIREEKAGAFKRTYTQDGYLYIARGYGMQDAGGYSIGVEALFLGENAIYFDSVLLGPEEEDASEQISYPYIVVKTEAMDKTVVFE